MIQEDYLMRMIESLGAIARKLIHKTQSPADFKDGVLDVRSKSKDLLGVDCAVLVEVSDETLVTMFTVEFDYAHAVKCLLAASLLNVQAQFQMADGESEPAQNGFRKALLLSMQALLMENALRTVENHEQIRLLMEKVSESEIPYALLPKLYLYQRIAGYDLRRQVKP